MKIYILCTCVVLFLLSSVAIADVYVRGYHKKNGTYVASHHRSDPNATQSDNWSTKGNQNPYTGKNGSRAQSHTAKKVKIKVKTIKLHNKISSTKKRSSSHKK